MLDAMQDLHNASTIAARENMFPFREDKASGYQCSESDDTMHGYRKAVLLPVLNIAVGW